MKKKKRNENNTFLRGCKPSREIMRLFGSDAIYSRRIIYILHRKFLFADTIKVRQNYATRNELNEKIDYALHIRFDLMILIFCICHTHTRREITVHGKSLINFPDFCVLRS